MPVIMLHYVHIFIYIYIYIILILGAHKMDVRDYGTVDMLMFYDKYQFRSGVRLLDFKLSENIRTLIRDAKRSRWQYTETDQLLEVVAAFISKDGAIDFPLTKKVLPAFALGLFYLEKKIEGSFFFVNPNLKSRVSLLLPLLPYVFDATNIDLGPVILNLVDIAYGATINERSREELKAIVLEDSFFPTLNSKLKQTNRLMDVLSNLKIRYINIGYTGGTNTAIAGRYKRHQRKDYGLGAMNCWYSMSKMVLPDTIYEEMKTFVVQALDGIGSRWTISAHVRGKVVRCGTTAPHNSILLYEWHKGENITSILPPKKGWICTHLLDPSHDPNSHNLFRLSYDINN